MANNQMNMQHMDTIDPNNLYNLGITPTACPNGKCGVDYGQNEGYLIPSIEEIASHNLATITRSDGTAMNNMNTPQNQRSIPSQVTGRVPVPDIETIARYQPITAADESLQTPAMVMNQGATMTGGAMTQITDISHPYPVTAESLQYLNGFIRTQIGRRVTIDFLIGSNTMVSKSGYLLGVAANYILINELDTNDLTTCDFYNIKFIRFYYG